MSYTTQATEQTVTFADLSKLNKVLQGDVWLADLGQKEGCLQSGIRPVVVLQNNTGNKHSPTTTVVPITSQLKHLLPVHTELGTQYGLKKTSTALVEQMTTINKTQLIAKLGKLDHKGLEEMKKAIYASFSGIL